MKRVMINLSDEVYKEILEMGEMLELSPSQFIRAITSVGLKTSKGLSKTLNDTLAKNMGVDNEQDI